MYLPEEHYLLTTALPASRAILSNIDLRRAAEYLDLLNLMAYDFYGHWTSRSGHHAQLYPSSSKEDESSCGAGIIAYLVSQGYPARKVLLGIPLFGRSFPGVAGPGHRFSKPSGDGTLEYHQLPRKGSKEHVDKRACAAYCVSSGSTGFTSYDNPDTVKMKAAFVKQKGLGVCIQQIFPNALPSPSPSPHSLLPLQFSLPALTQSVQHRVSFIGLHRRTRKIASEA